MVEDWLFLGLAHVRLGETEEAMRCLERYRSMPAHPARDFSWLRVEYDLLRQEFEAAITAAGMKK